MRRFPTAIRFLAAGRAETDEAGSAAMRWRPEPRLILLLLPLLAAALLAGLAALDLAGAGNDAGTPQLEGAPSPSSELPLEAGGDGAGKRAALSRGGFAVAAIESSRRKVRAPQRPPAEPPTLVASFVPVAMARPSTRRRRSDPPRRPSRPPRPFLSQGPPSRKTS